VTWDFSPRICLSQMDASKGILTHDSTPLIEQVLGGRYKDGASEWAL
jgi:hypothetical protein